MSGLVEIVYAPRPARVTSPGHASLKAVSASPSGGPAYGWMGQTR